MTSTKGVGVCVYDWICFCRFASRDVELPLHDGGLEPVEFLRSMGITLTPLNEAVGYKKVRLPVEVVTVFHHCLLIYILVDHLLFALLGEKNVLIVC